MRLDGSGSTERDSESSWRDERRVVLLELPLIALLQLLVLRDELDEAVRNGSVGLSVETSFHSFTVNYLLTLVEMLPRRRLL